LADFELVTRQLFGGVYGTAAHYNAAEHVWKLPNGAYIELGQLENAGDYAKYQGRSFSLLMVDEAGQFATSQLLDLLRSNMRGPVDMPIRMVMSANPGGPGHAWLAKRFVFRQAPWVPFHEDKSNREWIYAPSTYDGNQFIDRDQYAESLRASCPSDPELLRAWQTGDWSVARGAYFAAVLDEGRNALDPWQAIPQGWETFLAHDFGSSAPSVTYVCAKSPGDTVGSRYFPRGSLVLVDELATVKGDELNTGLGWTVPVLAEEICAMCKRWHVRAIGAGDDAIFAATGHAAGSIANEFMHAGVRFYPA
jgi:hypothetical protein